MKIYVASSWRNLYQPAVVSLLAALGHEVYDFKNPGNGTNGFDWANIDSQWQNWSAAEYKKALTHFVAQKGFDADFGGMQWADICVLVLPSGRSAHTEAGWMKGAGKKVFVFHPEDHEPELMYKIYDDIFVGWKELSDAASLWPIFKGSSKLKEVSFAGRPAGVDAPTKTNGPDMYDGNRETWLNMDELATGVAFRSGDPSKVTANAAGESVTVGLTKESHAKESGDNKIDFKAAGPDAYDGQKIKHLFRDEPVTTGNPEALFNKKQRKESKADIAALGFRFRTVEHEGPQAEKIPAKMLLMKKDILAELAFWGVSLCSGVVPFDFQVALQKADAAIFPFFFSTTSGMRDVSTYQLDEMLDVLKHLPVIRKWNLTSVEYTEGIDPDRNERKPFGFNSRYDNGERDSFIDLGALMNNIKNSLVSKHTKGSTLK